MFIPRGFGEYSITTKLGRMVYYTGHVLLKKSD